MAASSTLSDGYVDILRSAERSRGIENIKQFRVIKPCWTGGGEQLEVGTALNPTQESRRLVFNVNLGCTTAFGACTELCQLMPSAWKEFIAEGAHGCNMDEEALEMARRACGDWAGRVGNARKLTTDN
jgi:hypothetical protein